jgi:hypothetical protein
MIRFLLKAAFGCIPLLTINRAADCLVANVTTAEQSSTQLNQQGAMCLDDEIAEEGGAGWHP